MNQQLRDEVLNRAGGLCEGCSGIGDFRGLQHAHLVHRCMGGRKGLMKDKINDSANVALLCANCHDILDGRVYNPSESVRLSLQLKTKTGWYEWNER
jgi:hypothetical protein